MRDPHASFESGRPSRDQRKYSDGSGIDPLVGADHSGEAEKVTSREKKINESWAVRKAQKREQLGPAIDTDKALKEIEAKRKGKVGSKAASFYDGTKPFAKPEAASKEAKSPQPFAAPGSKPQVGGTPMNVRPQAESNPLSTPSAVDAERRSETGAKLKHSMTNAERRTEVAKAFSEKEKP